MVVEILPRKRRQLGCEVGSVTALQDAACPSRPKRFWRHALRATVQATLICMSGSRWWGAVPRLHSQSPALSGDDSAIADDFGTSTRVMGYVALAHARVSSSIYGHKPSITAEACPSPLLAYFLSTLQEVHNAVHCRPCCLIRCLYVHDV